MKEIVLYALGLFLIFVIASEVNPEPKKDYELDIKGDVYMLYDGERLVKVWTAQDIPQLDSIVNEDNQ